MKPLRFVATVRPKWRVVVEMIPADGEYAVTLNGLAMISLYRGEDDVRAMVRARYRGLDDWQPEARSDS